MTYAQLGIPPGEWDALTSPGFWDTNGSSNLDQKTWPSDSQQQQQQQKQQQQNK